MKTRKQWVIFVTRSKRRRILGKDMITNTSHAR